MAKTPKTAANTSATSSSAQQGKAPKAPKSAAPVARDLGTIIKAYTANEPLYAGEIEQVQAHYMAQDPKWFAAQVAKGNTRLFPNGCSQEQIDFTPPAQGKRGPAPSMTAQQAEAVTNANGKAPKAPQQGKAPQAPANAPKPPRAAAKGRAPSEAITVLPEAIAPQAPALPDSVLKLLRSGLAEAEFKGAPLNEVNDLRSQLGLPLLTAVEHENAMLKRQIAAMEARAVEAQRNEAAQAHEAKVEARPLPPAPQGEATIKHPRETSQQGKAVQESAAANAIAQGKPVVTMKRGKRLAKVDMSAVIARLAKQYLGLSSFEAQGSDEDWTAQHVTQLGGFAQDLYLAGYAAKEAELEAVAPQAQEDEASPPQASAPQLKRGPAPQGAQPQAPQAPQQAKAQRSAPQRSRAEHMTVAEYLAQGGDYSLESFERLGLSKVDRVFLLLTRDEGCTRGDILAATGWPSVSVPQQAQALGLTLYTWDAASGYARQENGRTVNLYTAE